MNKCEVAASNELLSAFLSDSLEAVSENTFLHANPHMFIFAKTNVEIPRRVNINVVENDIETVNLALPYYAGISDMTAFALSDEELELVTGGELLVLIFAIFGIGCGAIAATSAAACLTVEEVTGKRFAVGGKKIRK